MQFREKMYFTYIDPPTVGGAVQSRFLGKSGHPCNLNKSIVLTQDGPTPSPYEGY